MVGLEARSVDDDRDEMALTPLDGDVTTSLG